MKMHDMKIGFRLSLGFVLVIAITAMLGIYTQSEINQLNGLTNKLYKHPFVVSTAMLRINGNIIAMQSAMKDIALAESADQMDVAVAIVFKNEKAVLSDFEIVEEFFLGDISLVLETRNLFNDWRAIRNQVIGHMHLGERDKATEITKSKGAEHVKKLMGASEYMITLSYTEAETFLKNANEVKSNAINMTYVLFLLSFAAAGLIAWFITSSVVRPIRQAVVLAGKVAAGDLTRNIRVERKDEAGDLFQALRDMNKNLHKTVLSVKENASFISSGAQQISAGNLNLSQRTEEQASSLEETASSMEEMASTIQMNAESALQANQLSKAARSEAEKGGQVVERAISAMVDINTSSSKITDIIATIDGIAFQTNLLALNAAVEAARAGEQGRGFAVVANEVRSLAQRSADAAKEIKTLIQDTVDKVKVGTTLVDESGKTLSDIVNGVKKVSDIVADIDAASQEQSLGIGQVNKALSQMDDMTQQNAALVEESAAASRSMEDQANKLNDLMGFFKVNYSSDAKNMASSQMAGIKPVVVQHDKPEHIITDQSKNKKDIDVPAKKFIADLCDEWEDF